jgi:hypothetical protein
VAVLPARARRPKDKAKLENGVLMDTRLVQARLCHQRFFNHNELNGSMRTLLVNQSQRPFKKLPGSRTSAFAEMDQPALRPLPELRYEYAGWKVARVGIDYHVEVYGHYYSVPCLWHPERFDIALVELPLGKFDNSRDAAEVLFKHHRVTGEYHARQVIDGLVWGHLRAVRLSTQKTGSQVFDFLLGSANRRRRHLLMVTDDEYLLTSQECRQCPNVRL